MSYQDRVHQLAAAMAQWCPGPVEALTAAREASARAVALDAALTELRRAGERDRAAAVAELAAGKLDPAKVPARLAGFEDWLFDSPASKALVAAVAASHEAASRLTVDAAPKVFTVLQAAAAAVVDRAVALAASLPAGVRDREAAYRAGQDAFTAWMAGRTQAERLDALQELAGVMANAGWIAGPQYPGEGKEPHRGLMGVGPFLVYADPERLPAGYASLPPELRLAAAAKAGAGPGLYGWDDAMARRRRYGRRMGVELEWAPGSVATGYKNGFEAGAAMMVQQPPVAPPSESYPRPGEVPA